MTPWLVKAEAVDEQGLPVTRPRVTARWQPVALLPDSECFGRVKGDTQNSEHRIGAAHGGQVHSQEEQLRQLPLQPASRQRQVIATSEVYNSKAAAENGIESVRKNASNAELVDET